MSALHLRVMKIVALAALSASGCSGPELVDRTQPQYLKKSDLLQGQWYYKNTVVGAPNSPTAGLVGSGSLILEKIRWEIQEDLLVGYRTHEPVAGRDPRIDLEKSKIGEVLFKDGTRYKGAPVVAYKILSHFDRQRQYNPATGEQVNVLVEDMADRPWYQRDYMRVDWSSNALKNLFQCDSNNAPGSESCLGSNTQAVRYFTEEDSQAHDNAPVWQRDADGKLSYFDFTAQVVGEPATIDYPGYGKLPYCYVDALYDCESSNFLVRTAFMRVDEDRVKDYEPLVYDDKMMVKFGYFRTSTYTYDKGYGYTDQGRILYASRHNIWQKAHNGDGSVIPVERRAVRTIAYHLTGAFPAELVKAAVGQNSLESSWDLAFRRAIAVPRGLEADQVPQTFFVCENPVPDYSKRTEMPAQEAAARQAACGKAGTYVRFGDIRYHQITYIDQAAGGLLGYGPSFTDPETGEIVWATANMYGKTLDTWSGASQQVIDVLNGDLSLSQLIKGEDVKDFVSANLNPTDPRRKETGPNTGTNGLTADEGPSGSFARLGEELGASMTYFKKLGHLPLRQGDRHAVVADLIAKNPDIQQTLINLPEVRAMVFARIPHRGFQERLRSDAEFYKKVAYQTMMGADPLSLAQKAAREQRNVRNQVQGCRYELDYNDPDYLGTAKSKLAFLNQRIAAYKGQGHSTCKNASTCTDAEAKNLAKKDVYEQLRQEAWKSIAEHEVGHTLGLRHNFIGSADAMNYQDGYWDLRKQTIGVDISGKRVFATTPQNLVDASRLNQTQIDSGLQEYQYSSIMDYGSRVNSQNKGIGKYDRAAILFAYAGGGELGYVEVFNEMRNDIDVPNVQVPTDNQTRRMSVRSARLEFPLLQVQHYTPVNTYISDKFHYSTLPFMMAEKNLSFEATLDQGIARINSRSFMKWSEMKGWYDKVNGVMKDYQLSLGGAFSSDWEQTRDIMATVGPGMPVEVPYWFCSDSEVGANMMCNLNDQGADVYEMTSKWTERFEQSYVFSNFRRDRLSYDPQLVFQSKFARYLGNIPNIYQQWLFNVYFLQRYNNWTADDVDNAGLGDPIWQNYFTMAVIDSTNLLLQQLSTPPAGYHGKDKVTGRWGYVPDNGNDNTRIPDADAEGKFIAAMKTKYGYTDVVYVPRGPGRNMFTLFNKTGWDFFSKVDEVGHFWDQAGALSALTTSDTNFLGVDRGSDALRYSLPYYLTFDQEMAPLFSDVWTEDKSGLTSSLVKMGDGTARVFPRNYVRGENYISGFDYPPAPVAPLDAQGNSMAMEPVEANLPWGTRFYSQLLSMAYFTDNYNQEYAMLNRVYRLGSGDDLTPSPDFNVVSLPDPFGGGYVYSAFKRVSDPLGIEYSSTRAAAPRMIERATAHVQNWNTARGPNKRDSSDDVPVNDDHGVPRDASFWEGLVREDVRNLEMMRGMSEMFGQPLN